MLLLLFAFLSGLVIVLSPCVWPILPIIFSAGAGGKRQPLGMVVGLVLSLSLFTLLITTLLRIVPISPESLRTFAALLILLFGMMLIVPGLGHRLEMLFSRLSWFRMPKRRAGWKGGLVTGAAIGILWSPCAGPILATVGSLAATQSLSPILVLVMIAFALGVALPLYGLSLLSQHLLTETRVLSPYIGRIRQLFGVLVVLSALTLFTGYDVVLQERFVEFCSQNGLNFLSQFQTNPIVTDELESLRTPR